MAELLERAHLVDEHGVSEMQVRRGRIEAGLDLQGLPARELAREIGRHQQVLRAARQFRHLLFNRRVVHRAISMAARRL